jgi:DNA-binding CsgD family transcriptional regulator
MNIEMFSRLTGVIYDAAADPQRWPIALQAIQQAFSGTAATLILRDMTDMSGRWISTHDPDTEREFWEHWRFRNPIAVSAEKPRPKMIETDRDIVPKAELQATEYYNDFWRRREINACLQLWLQRQGTVQPSLSVARSRSVGEFDAPDIELGQLLLPHIQRAVTIEQRLQHTNITSDGAAHALDVLTHGVLVLDGKGRPLHLNQVAQRLIDERDGIRLDGGQLRGATPALTGRLGTLLARAIGRVGDWPLGGAVSLQRPSGRAPLAVVAVPLRQRIDWLQPYQPAICVCVSDPAEGPAVSDHRFRDIFGLTTVEAEIVNELVAGRTVRDIALQRNIALRTVRVHLSRIMEKTGTHRQADLVRVLMNIAPFDVGIDR